MQNKWKEIVGYENYYEISSDGYVRAKQRKVKSRYGYRTIKSKILKPCIDRDGYYKITLCKNNIKKTKTIHRLVAEAFLENPYNLPVINHKDENKLNNNVSNLEWCTVKYNTNYGDGIEKRASKRRVPIIAINNNITLYFSSIREAEIKLNLHHSNIVSCLQNKRKTCGGYIFKYNRTVKKTVEGVSYED